MLVILNLVARLWSEFESRQGRENWVRKIYRDGRPLIDRYYTCSTRWIDDSEFFTRHPRLQRMFWWASYRAVLHHMHESDLDGLHDHPWPWASWVLSGGYWEHAPEGKFWRWPGHLRFRSAKALHRLELDPNTRKEVWTLFLMGPRQREWGFVDREHKNWVPWYKHHGLVAREQEHAMQG